MISGIFIVDFQGDILIERSYVVPSPRLSVKKLIASNMSPDGTGSGLLGGEIVWEMDQRYFFAIKRDQVLLIASAEGDVFIPEVYEILHRIEEVLTSALVELSVESIRAISAEIMVMLEYLCDFGMPMIPSIKALASMIRKSTFTEKIKRTFTKKKSLTDELDKIVAALENKSALDSSVMWKDTTSKYSSNQSVFEVVERLECLLDNEGNMIDSRILGTIFSTCVMQGSPEVSLNFKTTFPIQDFCMHKDALLAKSVEQFKNSGLVRFVPADNTIELLRYTIDNPPVALPFNLNYDLLVKPEYLKLKITITPMMVQGEYLKVNNFVLVMHLPAAFSTQSLAAKSSIFLFDDKEAKGEWKIKKIENTEKYTLEGNLKISDYTKLKGKNITLSLSYEVPEYVASGATITKISYRNAEVTPKKLVRYGLYANIEMRLSGLL